MQNRLATIIISAALLSAYGCSKGTGSGRNAATPSQSSDAVPASRVSSSEADAAAAGLAASYDAGAQRRTVAKHIACGRGTKIRGKDASLDDFRADIKKSLEVLAKEGHDATSGLEAVAGTAKDGLAAAQRQMHAHEEDIAAIVDTMRCLLKMTDADDRSALGIVAEKGDMFDVAGFDVPR